MITRRSKYLPAGSDDELETDVESMVFVLPTALLTSSNQTIFTLQLFFL